MAFIRITCPCNVYPLEPHFYIAKLGYAGVYLFFLKKNIKIFPMKFSIFTAEKNLLRIEIQILAFTG